MQTKKEVNSLIIVFVIIGILGIAVKLFEFYHIKIISTTTADIYKHPLNVSNAALQIEFEVYKIHSHMKDIILSLSNEELLALIEEVNHHEQQVYKNLNIIEQNILVKDDLILEKETKKLFNEWKPIRDEVISLVKNAKKNDALSIYKDHGDKHVLKLEASTFKLYTFAHDKAINFKNKSVSSFEVLEIINYLVSSLVLILFIVLGYYIIHRISKHISKNGLLNNVLSIIRDVNQLIVREKDPQVLIQESCNILTSTHVYSNAWIVIYDKNMGIEYSASTYDSASFIAFREKLKKAWIPNCISKTANGNNLYSFIKNTKNSCSECPIIDEYKDASAFNIALKHNEKLYGYLTLSIDSRYINDKDELALLDEVANDIAYAFYNIEMNQKLIASEKRYRYVVEATNDGLWDWNLVTNEMYCSPRWKNMLGYNDDELENTFETWKKLIHPDDEKQALLEIQLSHENKTKQYKNIHKLKHKDGHWVWVETRGQTLFDTNNKPIRMIGSLTDITNEKESENTILHLKELYDNVIDSIDNLIFVKDCNYVYITCNTAFEKFIGKPKDQIIGKTDYDLMHKDLADFFREHDEIMLSQGTAKSNFEWVTYPDGRKIYLLTVKSPLVNAEGQVLGLVGNSADFTERQGLYERLEEAQSLAKIGSWEYDIIKDKLSCSNEIFKIYGFSDLNMKLNKDTFVKQQHPEDMEEAEEVFQNSLHSLEMLVSYNRIIRKDDGAIRYMEHRWRTEYDDNGVAIKTIGTTQDITEGNRVKKNLIESNRKLISLMNSLPGMAYRCKNDAQWSMEFLSEGCQELTGYKSSDILNNHLMSYADLIHPDDREMVWNEVQAGLKEKHSFEIEYRLITANNDIKWVWEYGAGIYADANEGPIIEGVILDNDARKRAEQDLVTSNTKFEKAFNSTPNPIMIHNEDGKVLMLNKVWKELSGYSFDEINTIEKWTKNAYGKKMTVIKEYIDTLYGINTVVDEGEYSINTKNKDTIIWQFRSAPLGVIDGKRTVISSAMDITELKNKDEMLINQSRLAAMGEMIGMIAHQWRQPLTVISMNANNMLLDIELGDLDTTNIKEYSNDILMQTQHLSKTIDDFRNFFKPDKSASKVKIQEILEETYKIVKDSLANNNITLKTSYASESEVDAYPRELMQVFVNIINNAKDSLLQVKSKEACIDIKVFEDEEYVITEICDNGLGIDAAILSKIFDPYFTTKDEKTGTGLGLYMSKMID